MQGSLSNAGSSAVVTPDVNKPLRVADPLMRGLPSRNVDEINSVRDAFFDATRTPPKEYPNLLQCLRNLRSLDMNLLPMSDSGLVGST